jgi:alginate O-acetyltransferase complex protein AlgI
MVVTVLVLCGYKYAVFLSRDLLGPFFPAAAARSAAWLNATLPAAAPLGVSFFAFEFVHYLYEIRRGAAPLRNPLRFLLFAIFYPSLVAGPIKRFREFDPALSAGAERVTAADLLEGLQRIALGFFKKVVIADNLTSAIDHFSPRMSELPLGGRWLFLAALALRIVADFSGYSDIAIGAARLLGIRLPENFNWPYAARNLQDFWQRWHISLSSWIRDYVYIPLGGNRVTPWRRATNVLLAFALCGLWHGPAWNFALWGIYHGAGLAIQAYLRFLPGVGAPLHRFLAAAPAIPGSSRKPLFGSAGCCFSIRRRRRQEWRWHCSASSDEP